MSRASLDGQKATVKIENDMVASSVEALKIKLKNNLDEGATQIALDMSLVTMVDSMGIGLLVATHNSLQKLGNKLELLNVSEDIRNLLKNMRLDKHFSI